ncbi:hypothetical protein [Sphingobium nicotianae]|uniref:Uncharacterized protein n=1 Tax=Sphingobium nicotianae TaxID=2782607 RepID=A0A9X1D9Y3_9SPHN|nr:hypothetical protein [Sphingobium nicotianae]MBT2185988.1 hypothetical protein [Sphingobium nicotianae]
MTAMVRQFLLPLVLATAICVAVLLAVHRPPLETVDDARLLAMLAGMTLAFVAAVMLLLVPAAMLLRAAALPYALAGLGLAVAGGVIGKALLWLVLAGLPIAAMLPGAGVALIWLSFNHERLAR